LRHPARETTNVSTYPSKASLSQARRRLLELMQRMNFGRIEGLVVRGGEPVLAPLPRVVREHKFGGENGPRPERDAEDFLLKAQVVELCHFLDRFGDGTIALVEVKHGLPFKLEVVGPPA
jgi:hypothetical protein